MSSPVLTISEGMKEKKQNKTKIGVGSVVKAKVGEMVENRREGRSRRTRKEVVGCVHAVVGKKTFLVKFENGQKKQVSSCSLVFLSSKEEGEMDESLSNSCEKEQGELLTIYGGPEVREPCMFGKVMYLSVFCCLCYVKDISTDMVEEQVSEERDTYLNEEEDIIMDDSREEHWRDVAEEGGDKKEIRELRWEVYVKEKEELIKRDFLVSIPYLKGGGIFGLVWSILSWRESSNTKLLDYVGLIINYLRKRRVVVLERY